MSKRAPPERDAQIIKLYRQGYFCAEISPIIAKIWGVSLSRERIRQIVRKNDAWLEKKTFQAIRIRRRYPQEMIKCACGCGQLLPKYIYYSHASRVTRRSFAVGHHRPIPPAERRIIAGKISATKKRQWANGVYDGRKPSPRELANRKKVLEFVKQNPGCSIEKVHQGTKVGWGRVKYHALRLCNMGKVKSRKGGMFQYSLTLKKGVRDEMEN